MARQRFELAMARQLRDSVTRRDLHLPSLTETTKREGPQEVPALLLRADLEKPPGILAKKRPVQARQVVL